MTAWAFKRDSRNRKGGHAIRKIAKHMILDSGFLGAAKKGELDWKDNQDIIVKLSLEYGFDLATAIDIPCEPHILKEVGLSKEEAFKITMDNMISFMEMDVPCKKMLVVQGWLIEDYISNLKEMEKNGAFSGEYWIGVGSVCMRKPNTQTRKTVNDPKYMLYDVAREVCSFIDSRATIHCFGIAHPKWVKNLSRIGVNSCDSSSAVMATAFGEEICPQYGSRRKIYEIEYKNTVEGRALLLRQNRLALESSIINPDEQLRLF
tara:strand:+ start:1069 stop:1854 length:786 start_codon:yes stop_codon:yes gene_type:complete